MIAIVNQMNTVSLVILFGILTSLPVLYLLLKHRLVKYHRFFFLFMCSLTAIQIEAFLSVSGYFFYVIHLLNITTPLILLLGPFLYCYTRAILDKTETHSLWSFHYLPFVFFMAYSFFFILQPAAVKYEVYARSFQSGVVVSDAVQSFPTDPLNIQGYVVVELLSLHVILYAVMGLIKVHSKKSALRNWLFGLNIFLLAGGLILMLSEGGVIQGVVLFKPLFPSYFAKLTTSIIVYSILFLMISNYKQIKTGFGIYAKSSLPKKFRQASLEKIIAFMEEEKPYLSNTFSRSALSQQTSLSTNHLSQILNKELNQTFYEFLNRYRIQEAKRVLVSNEGLKIEDLANRVGYNSKSAFYNAFKKSTGTTPGQYKSQNQS